jgi:hypothetical protein
MKNKRATVVKAILVIGACMAVAGVPSDGRAGNGTVTLWLDDVSNTTGNISFCTAVSSDTNGSGNGNAGTSTVTKDKNGSGNGNAGQGSRQVCLFNVH